MSFPFSEPQPIKRCAFCERTLNQCFQIFVDRLFQTVQGLHHGCAPDLRTCNIKVTAALQLFENQLYVDIPLRACGDMYGIVEPYQGKGA